MLDLEHRHQRSKKNCPWEQKFKGTVIGWKQVEVSPQSWVLERRNGHDTTPDAPKKSHTHQQCKRFVNRRENRVELNVASASFMYPDWRMIHKDFTRARFLAILWWKQNLKASIPSNKGELVRTASMCPHCIMQNYMWSSQNAQEMCKSRKKERKKLLLDFKCFVSLNKLMAWFNFLWTFHVFNCFVIWQLITSSKKNKIHRIQ